MHIIVKIKIIYYQNIKIKKKSQTFFLMNYTNYKL